MGLFWALSFTFLCFFTVTMCETNVDETQTFIVRVQNDLKPSEFSTVEEWYSSTLQSLTSNNPLSNSENPTTTQRGNQNEFLYIYKTVFHGFAATLTKKQAEILKGRKEILGVFPDEIREIRTTRTPQFLGLTASTPNNPSTLSDSGNNIIIGVFDTGIWPERRSFNDEGLGPIPSRWKGKCTEGEKFSKTICNKKLIGARYFSAGYKAVKKADKDSYNIKSARDSQGHGTHTASTAAGNRVSNASFLGFAKGDAAGIAPKARIAVYKICWVLKQRTACLGSDTLGAFEKAIEDGVDIISMSVGGPSTPYHHDPQAIGSFAAMERGIFVSASAGNDGPTKSTVENTAPWITSVGAGSIDRNFPADLVLGDGRVITGASFYNGSPLPNKTYFSLIHAKDASLDPRHSKHTAAFCYPDSLDPNLIRGKIVVCDRGQYSLMQKASVVKEAGGAGVVIANVSPYGEGLITESYLFPGLLITESAANIVKTYMRSSQNPKATIVFRGTRVGVKPAPVVAHFSSRGPNPESMYILKPNLFAPGLNILAAWPDNVSPTRAPYDLRRTEFMMDSGTSMACPHVSGLAALLKGVHPDWSPAMIQSALMTTAYVHDHDHKPILVEEKVYGVATAFDMGAGHVDPIKAVDPGLVYDLTINDYLDFLCASKYSPENIEIITQRQVDCRGKSRKPWNLNYPSISVAFRASGSSKLKVVVTRTVTHVSEYVSNYTVIISNPKGVIMTVNPPTMEFKKKGQKQSYKVWISAENVTLPRGGQFHGFGKLTWTDGKHHVTSPIVVTWH